MSAISPVPKPTVIPQWAATTPGGAPASGTCVQPPSSSSDNTVITQQTGWIPGTAPPAQYDNYFKNLVCQWIAYLADLNNQRFTDAGVGSWSQPHAFDAGVTATNTSGPAITATGSEGGMSPAIEATSNTAAAAAISATGSWGSPAIMATGGGAIGSAAMVVTGGIQTTGGGYGAGIAATGGVTATNTSGPAITATGSGMSPAILATANGIAPAIEAVSNTAAAAISATGGEIFDALSITAGNHIATVTQEAQAITTAAGTVPPSPSTTTYAFAIPDGATLTGVAVWINCLSGTHTSWPVNGGEGLAHATIVRWTINGGVTTAITGGSEAYDPALNLAASNAGRAIPFTITNEPAFNRATTLYQVYYGQEYGSGAVLETITGIVVYYTPSRLSPAPG